MATLKETKDRISSVKQTLKITSAMKVVASAKLHKAQKAIEDLLPYEKELFRILSLVPRKQEEEIENDEPQAKKGKVAIVAISSNSSLCGGFNANVIKVAAAQVRSYEAEGVQVFAIGRKIADPFKKAGYPSPKDYSSMVGTATFAQSAELAEYLIDRYNSGEYSKVVLVYNHFVSTSTQKVLVETYLPFEVDENAVAQNKCEDQYIMEPEPEKILEELLPKVMKLKIHAVILDSLAAEHAARTVAMQTATDNAEELISDLTLEYNKGRQQKITAEILDLVGGSL